jgi:lysyl-tRNA synthetase class 1
MTEQLLEAKSWPFQIARSILKRINNKIPAKGYVLFETGYGPSGLPHIGTFGEVARTSMVKKAFETLAPNIPTKLLCISDDMDGMRKIPDNLPNQEMLKEHLHKPLTAVPDPFGTHQSYGHHMNSRLCAFLDSFNFDYEFKSATDCYKEGVYDTTLLNILRNYDKVMAVMLPTLGSERQQTYSPFLPVSPKSGKVLQVPAIKINADKGTIIFADEDGSEFETPVIGGHCKLQWKPDMGMRWAAFDVDFEMYGKDHLTSAKLYSAICKIAGGNPPEQFMYELFLDDKGGKISKSKGNGLTMDEWLRYAPPESLAYYMFNKPKTAKRLHFDIIPKATDEYLQHLRNYKQLAEDKKLDSPIFYIDNQNSGNIGAISFALLLNLVSASNSENKEILWGFISKYDNSLNPKNTPLLDHLVEYAINYYDDFIKPHKNFRNATEQEKEAISELRSELEKLEIQTAENIQQLVYGIGTKYEFNMRDWFQALYEILLGQSSGPRMGSFITLYGVENTIALIKNRVA